MKLKVKNEKLKVQNSMKFDVEAGLVSTRGITLISLVITIVVLIILAGVAINLTLGENGIITKAKKSTEEYKIRAILEKLELEKVELVAKKNGTLQSVQEYVEHLISKGIITTADVVDIGDDAKNITVEGYKFLVEKGTSGDIKITYQGNADEKPKIANIQVIEVTPNSIKVKVVTSQFNGGTFTYGIKNITTNEANYKVVVSKISQDEYEFTELTPDNEYKIEVKIENDKGEDTKETNIAIRTDLPTVSEISLDKTTLSILKGSTETLTAKVLPTNARDTSVTWTSSDNTIATVDAAGVVTAVAEEGKATITATANGGEGIIATCVVTVIPPTSATVGGSTHTEKAIQYSWEELGELAKVISNNYGKEEGKINNQTVEVAVSINGKSDTLGIGDTTTVDGNTVRILGFNHDKLVDQTVYGGKNVYSGISFEYVNFLTTAKLNNSASNKNGWEGCSLRISLNGGSNDKTSGIVSRLENKEQIKKVKKQYIKTYNSTSSVLTSEDYLWLLSCSEIWNNGYSRKYYGLAITKEGDRYKYYDVKLGSTKYNTSNSYTKKSGEWWLRSPQFNVVQDYCFVSSGACHSQPASTYDGVAPGFSI